jgi:hypothetical protein
VASDLCHVAPYVYNAPDGSAVIVFSGYLSNVHELAARYPACASPKLDASRRISFERGWPGGR